MLIGNPKRFRPFVARVGPSYIERESAFLAHLGTHQRCRLSRGGQTKG